MGKKKKRKSAGQNKKRSVSKKEPLKSSKSKKIPLFIAVVAISAIGGYLFYINNIQGQATVSEQRIASKDIPNLRGGETRPVLRPSRFTGKIARAYRVAQENRDLLDSLYCYCNCKPNLGHKSLLTCYTNNHAERCSICLNQALYANSKFKEGLVIAQVRKAVDKKFWRPLR
jgi:hypothetical protein